MRRLVCMFLCGWAPGCAEDEARFAHNVVFQGMVNSEEFSCAAEFELGRDGVSSVFTDFKMYVSEFRLVSGGVESEAVLVADGAWQDGVVALLDFEDGTGTCVNGTGATNNQVRIESTVERFDRVKFTLGVPAFHNHQDASVATSPMNLTSMFWSWQAGYKFLRVDGRADGGGFRLHLGSTGCQPSDDGTECASPNRFAYDVELSDTGVVELDIAQVFANLAMTPDQNNNSQICMSAGEEACGPMFDSLNSSFLRVAD